MASVSFNKKGFRVYAKFTDRGFPTVHLGKSKAECIKTLQRIFEQRQYLLNEQYTQQDFDRLLGRINENLKY